LKKAKYQKRKVLVQKWGAAFFLIALVSFAEPALSLLATHPEGSGLEGQSCEIQEDSEIEITYLHGWRNELDSYKRSHKNSLRALQVAQERCGFSIFAPDSLWICNSPVGEVRCWNRGQWNQRLEVSEFLKTKTEECFGPKSPTKIRILFGFSDGAYFLNKMQSQFLEHFDYIVISGGPKAKLHTQEIRQNPNHSVSSDALIEFLQKKLNACR
jgi:hypothetical protein